MRQLDGAGHPTNRAVVLGTQVKVWLCGLATGITVFYASRIFGSICRFLLSSLDTYPNHPLVMPQDRSKQRQA